MIRSWRTWNLGICGCFAISLVLAGCGRSEPAPASATPADTGETVTASVPDQQLPAAAPPPSKETVAAKDPGQLREDAMAALHNGDKETADKLARAALSAAPADSETVFLMAYVLGEQNRFAEAIKMLDDLLESDPSTRIPVLGQTAEWMVLHGQWDQAETRYRTLLEEVDDTSLIHRRLAQLFFRQGRRQQAIHHVSQLCRLGNVEEVELRTLVGLAYPVSPDTDELDPIGVLGNARYEISQGNSEATVAKLADSQQPREIALLGRLFAQQRDLVALAEWVGQVPESANDMPDYWFALGVHEAGRGKHQAAVASFCEVVLRDQTDKEAYQKLSHSLEQLGASDESKAAAKRAELIEQTQLLAHEMSQSDTPDLQQIAKLSDFLEQLQRPLEAMAWFVVELIYADLPKSELNAQLTEINQKRLRYLETEQPAASREFILCGVDLQALLGDQ